MKPFLDFGTIQIPTFYLVISLSLSFCILSLNQRLLQPGYSQINKKIAFDLILIIMISGFLGARLTHVLYEEFDFYKTFPLEIFKFWKGGFVYYGGFILAVLTSLLYLKSKKENFWVWADLLTPYISLTYAFGRIGCFLEGCCYGRFCELPWSIQHKHPTQLYMFFAEIFLLIIITSLKIKRPNFFKNVGVFFSVWICGHSICRFFIEFYRADERGLIVIFSISQWLSLFLFILFSLNIYRLCKKTI